MRFVLRERRIPMRKMSVFLAAALLALCVSASGQTIVRKFKLHSQTGIISPRKIFVPGVAGLYRVSTVMVLTQANGNVGTAWYWGLLNSKQGQTSGQQTAIAYPLYVGSLDTGMASGVITLSSDAGQPIMFSTVPGGDVTGAIYDVYIVIERL